MSITDGLRKAFDDCTVMAGVEDKFECVYITKAAATKLLDEVDEAIAATLGNDGPERSKNGVERSSDGVDTTCVPDDYTAKLMAEVERLQGENARLLKELEAEHALAEQLGHYHEDAKAENAKLREQLDTAERNRKRNFREYARLCHENDELRELGSVMAYCMQYERECDGCRLNGADGKITAPVGCDGLHERLHELGIEVDA